MTLKNLRIFDYIFIVLFLFAGIFLCVNGMSQRGSKVVVNAGGKQFIQGDDPRGYSLRQLGIPSEGIAVEGPEKRTDTQL